MGYRSFFLRFVSSVIPNGWMVRLLWEGATGVTRGVPPPFLSPPPLTPAEKVEGQLNRELGSGQVKVITAQPLFSLPLPPPFPARSDG